MVTTKEFNIHLKDLKSIIKKEANFSKVKKLLFELHSMVHSSKVYTSNKETLEDFIWNNMDLNSVRTSADKNGRTALYSFWHCTRIEDITMNLLVKNRPQVFNENWKNRINSSITDTGNSLSNEEILKFSNDIDIPQLKNYRDQVAIVSKEIINNLLFSDLKTKFNGGQLNNVFEENAVSRSEGSSWLVDFWGKKETSGILFMPLTRHNLVHLNEILKLKEYRKII